MRRRLLFSLLVAGTTLLACDGLLDVDFDNARAKSSSPADLDSSSDPGIDAAGSPDGSGPPSLIPASKVDVLLVVDNSASMGDKNKLLAASLGTFLTDAVRVGDLHLGVISSSLGNVGGDVCDPANPRTNDRAHLRNTDDANIIVPEAAATGFLSYKRGDDVPAFVSNAAKIVRGVGETGCGLEAQLEAMYRFLVQPDPFVTVTLDANNQANLGTEIDIEVLAQRRAFLRPDSALVVIMITDEDDSSVDPLSVGGQGWAFTSRSFPGSRIFRGGSSNLGTTAPRATSICATNPSSDDCTSCGFQTTCDPMQPACLRIRADINCQTSGQSGQSGDGYNGYFPATDDDLNVRCHRMKERFGIDPQFPLSRYIDGFTQPRVADRKNERTITTNGPNRIVGPYLPKPNCTNPIFATNLPSQPGDELCNLRQSTRSSELVVFAILGGVPEVLATAQPDWTKIVGTNPDNFNYSGIDPHMIPSISPRSGLAPPAAVLGDNGADPIHGREWNTDKTDLQYACTFPIATPRICQANNSSCDCSPGRPAYPPLCSATVGEQIRGKAYPTPRPLRVARGLGDRGVIGSICAGQGYDATMRTLFRRLQPRLAL